MQRSYFLLNTSDPDLYTEESGAKTRKGSAFELTCSRLERNFWPLYARTRYSQYLVPGTEIAFYIGGSKNLSKHIVARSTIESVVPWDRRISLHDDNDKYLTDLPSKILELKDTMYLKSPINFKEILPELSARPKNIKYWGVIMQGGVTSLPKNDWDIMFR